MNTERMEWIPQELLDRWQQPLQEHDRSAGTVKKYTQAVARFLTWYEAEEQAPLQFSALTPIALLGIHIVYSSAGVERSFLRKPETRFSLMRRVRLAAVGRVGLRGISTCWNSSRRACIRSKAASRLACCDLRSVAVTVIPVGRCTNRTPVSTLLRCCPPGPLAIMNSRSQSRSSDSRSVGYIGTKKTLPFAKDARNARSSPFILSHVRTRHR